MADALGSRTPRRRSSATAGAACQCGRAGRLEVDHVQPLQQAAAIHGTLDPTCNPSAGDVMLRKPGRENERPRTEAELRWRRLVADMMLSTLNSRKPARIPDSTCKRLG